MKRILSVIALVLTASCLWAQVPQVLFYGYIEEGIFQSDVVKHKKKGNDETPKKLSDARVFVYVGDSLLRTMDARSTGFYALLLDGGEKYRVVFEREGYFCKCFEMDCRNVAYNTEEGAMKCLTDVSLFKKVDNADLLSFCKVPYAKCKYDTETIDMAWDMEYTQRAKEKFYELAEPYYLAQKK
ncbi:MAG: hypothetical protein SH856_09835 [Flavobacteriales bacterium]|nr:hypothetical protein [Flavobacteriales bacterium]